MSRRTHEERGGAPFTFGLHLVMDLEGCDTALVRDPEVLKQYTCELVKFIDMVPYGPPWLAHFGHNSPVTSGYTVFQPIETSSITLVVPAAAPVVRASITPVTMHLGDAAGDAHIDVFSCQEFDWDAALTFSEKFFRAEETTYTPLYR